MTLTFLNPKEISRVIFIGFYQSLIRHAKICQPSSLHLLSTVQSWQITIFRLLRVSVTASHSLTSPTAILHSEHQNGWLGLWCALSVNQSKITSPFKELSRQTSHAEQKQKYFKDQIFHWFISTTFRSSEDKAKWCSLLNYFGFDSASINKDCWGLKGLKVYGNILH